MDTADLIDKMLEDNLTQAVKQIITLEKVQTKEKMEKEHLLGKKTIINAKLQGPEKINYSYIDWILTIFNVIFLINYWILYYKLLNAIL